MTITVTKDRTIQNLENLSVLSAHWVSRDTFLLPPEKGVNTFVSLVSTDDDAIFTSREIPAEHREIRLVHAPSAFTPALREKYPHLSHYNAFTLDPTSEQETKAILRSIFFLAFRNEADEVRDVCGLQIPGVVDDLYAYDGKLGVEFTDKDIKLRVWAPLARNVRVHLFDQPTSNEQYEIVNAEDRNGNGVWSIQLPLSWKNSYYLFEVENYYQRYRQVSKQLVTDPYSVGLSMNSKRSQLLDLNDESWMPAGWKTFEKPKLEAFEDMAVYELHVRDFSASDQTVVKKFRGTYKAFTQKNSNGMGHLRKIANAGVTHIQLMPVYDFATVNEDRHTWKDPDHRKLHELASNSNQQAEMTEKTLGKNGYNWGYDPFHYGVPEGSYATDPNGGARVLEFREMVMALSLDNLRVVMDVVYNHMFADGLDALSVLDKVVPGYYHRLDHVGRTEKSTCCPNIASEHSMATRLMVDTLLIWAKHYKVDGFRFDLMGHIMLADMLKAKKALRALDIEKDGVDGSKICLYGEGWDFGEVANNTRGRNASIKNTGGSGIGVFNDRLRDAVRGGAAFGNIFEQGFATGLFSQPNHNEGRDHETLRWRLMEHCDLIKIGLAGSLRSFQFARAGGEYLRTDQIWYNGQLAGFADDPEENIMYVSAHDNETLWDVIQMKTAPYISNMDRVRMNNLALSIIALGQGIPFFHAGDDLLRSKSLDRNTYNAGDWFNRIDWTYETNNWGVGLPIEGKEHWAYFSHLLGDPKRVVTRKEIQFAAETFQMYLRIRKSSPLFRLRNAEQVNNTVNFMNNGPSQIPGLVVYRLRDNLMLDKEYEQIIVFFNANPGTVYFGDNVFVGQHFDMHPIQSVFYDEIMVQSAYNRELGEFKVPGRTATVFVKRR